MDHTYNNQYQTCPKCGRHDAFKPLEPALSKKSSRLGVCKYTKSCGYSYLPIDLYKEDQRSRSIQYIPFDKVVASARRFEENNFVTFLNRQFGNERACQAISEYHIGTTKNPFGGTIFWQIDKENRVTEGLYYLIDPDTGRKSTNEIVFKIFKKLFPGPCLQNPCLFGSHLINKNQQKQKVILKEPHKAVIGSIVYPDFVWLAAGSIVHQQYQKRIASEAIWYPENGFEQIEKSFQMSKIQLTMKQLSNQDTNPYSFQPI